MRQISCVLAESVKEIRVFSVGLDGVGLAECLQLTATEAVERGRAVHRRNTCANNPSRVLSTVM